MEKRCRPPQGYNKSLETNVSSRPRMCDRKPDALMLSGSLLRKSAVESHFSSSSGMDTAPARTLGSPTPYLPPQLIEAFENPDPDPVRVEEARERIGLLFETGMKVPLQYEESLEIRHDVVRSLFPQLPAEIRDTLLSYLLRVAIHIYLRSFLKAKWD